MNTTMTFSCPNTDPKTNECTLLHKVCVPGRPGCIQEETATFAEDLETRIKRAEDAHLQKSDKRRRTR